MVEENEVKKPSYLEELRAEKEDLKKERAEFEKVKDEARSMINSLEQLKQEKILAGTAGGHVEEPPKIESPKEYKDRILRGGI